MYIEENIYKTNHLAEIAVLLIYKQKLITYEKIGKAYWFMFENNEECKKISDNYFFGEVMVNARKYYETINRLKNRIYDSRNRK